MTCSQCLGKLTVPDVSDDIRAMAQAAWDDRPDRKCNACNGRGKLNWPLQRGDGEFVADCQMCHGTGIINDGSLDPVRLAVLADALEEVGADEWLIQHLRGMEPVLKEIGGPGGQVVREPIYRIIGWRPLPGPHVRGCFAISSILGQT